MPIGPWYQRLLFAEPVAPQQGSIDSNARLGTLSDGNADK